MDTVGLLDKLANTRNALAKVSADRAALVEAAMPQEVKDRLAEIETEFSPILKEGAENAANIEKQIKAAVLETHGETVRGASLMAVWSKGRVSWDTKALDGYLKAHPELDEFRSEGEPSVSIREVK